MKEIIYDALNSSSAQIVENLLLSGGGKIPRGAKAELAKFINCHPSYLGQILSEKVVLSVDQAMLISEWASFSNIETEIFISLVSYERAGALKLKSFYKNKIKELLGNASQVAPHLKNRKDLSSEQLVEYCSNWTLQIIHASLQIDSINTDENISKATNLSPKVVSKSLLRLQAIGLIKKINDKWTVLEKNIHISTNYIAQNQFHITWRLASANNILTHFHEKSKEDFRFSSLIITSQKQREKIRQKLVKLISDAAAEIEDSPSEEVSVLSMDLFRVKNSL